VAANALEVSAAPVWRWCIFNINGQSKWKCRIT
jgi:hypothetical protein